MKRYIKTYKLTLTNLDTKQVYEITGDTNEIKREIKRNLELPLKYSNTHKKHINNTLSKMFSKGALDAQSCNPFKMVQSGIYNSDFYDGYTGELEVFNYHIVLYVIKAIRLTGATGSETNNKGENILEKRQNSMENIRQTRDMICKVRKDILSKLDKIKESTELANHILNEIKDNISIKRSLCNNPIFTYPNTFTINKGIDLHYKIDEHLQDFNETSQATIHLKQIGEYSIDYIKEEVVDNYKKQLKILEEINERLKV